MNRSRSKATCLNSLRQGSLGRILRVALALLLVFPLQPTLLFANPSVPTAALPSALGTQNQDLDALRAVDVDPQTGALIAPVIDLSFGTGALKVELRRQFRQFEEGQKAFGKGWSSALNQRLEGLDGEAVCFVDATGHRRWFEKSGNDFLATRGYEAKLVKADKGWQITGFGDSKTYSFDSTGRLVKIATGQGAAIEFNYQAELLQSVKTPFGTLTVQHNASQAISAIQFKNKTWKYVYNSEGQLSRVIQPSLVFWDYSYDTKGRLSGIGSQAITVKYDAVDRVTELRGESIRPRTFMYMTSVDPFRSYMTLIEDATGRLSLVSHSYDGKLIETMTTEGERSTVELDDRDRPVVVVNPNNQKWEYGYDDQGRHRLTVAPNGLLTKYSYEGSNLQPSKVQRGSDVFQFQYDQHGRLVKMTAPTGATETFAFDELDRISTSTDIRGLKRDFSYDANGYLSVVKNSLNQVEKFQFNDAGELTAYTRQDGVKTTIAYNAQGKITSVKEADAREIKFEYNHFGQETSKSDQFGRRIDTNYNKFGEITAVSDGAGLIQAFEYDDAGRVISMTDANGNQTKYAYGESKFAVTNAHGYVRKYLKNKLGNVTQETLPNGQNVHYEYNKQGLLERVISPDRQLSSFKYDKMGRITYMGNKSGQFGLTYDQFGRISQLKDEVLKKAIKYEYNSASDRIAMQLPFGRVEYQRDSLGRIVAVKDIDGKKILFSYNSNSQRTAIRYPNGVSTKFSYDAQRRLTKILTVNSEGKTLSSREYGYDKFDRRVSAKNEKGEVENFSYDNRGRLTKVVRKNGSEEFTYDEANNRTSHTVDGRTKRYVIGKNNEILSSGVERFSYDKFGRLARKISRTGVVKYEYDHNDKLVKLTKANGSVIKFGYAPNGTRVWRERDGKRRYYLYDFADVVAEYSAKGKLTRSYTHGPDDDDVLASHANGKSSYYHYDAVRSVVAMSGQKGDVVAKYSYDAFGKVTSSEGQASRWNPYGFNSRRRDPAAGLVFFRARFYMASIGRFTTQDPAGFFDGPNRYAFARNNPVEYNDPYGLWSLKGLWNKTVSGVKSAGRAIGNAAVKTWEVASTAATHIGKNPVAFAKGFGKGLYNGAKGIVNMVIHPVETFNGIKHAIVNFEETKEAMGELWRKYKKAYAENPEAFADMSGQILGELTLAIAGTKGLDKVAKLKTLSNIAKAGSKVSKATGVTRAAGSVGTKVAAAGRSVGSSLASAGRKISQTAGRVGAKVARRYPKAAAAARVLAQNGAKVADKVKSIAAKRVARAKALNRARQMRKARIAALGGNFLVRSGRAIAAFPGQVLKAGRNFIRDPGAFLGYGAFAMTRTALKATYDMAKLGRHVGVYGTFPANIIFRDSINKSIDRYKNSGEAKKAVKKATEDMLDDAEDLSDAEFADRLNKTGQVYEDYRNSLIKPVRDANNAYNEKIEQLSSDTEKDPMAVLSEFEQASRDWANANEGLLRSIYMSEPVEGEAYNNPSDNRSRAYENEVDFLEQLSKKNLSDKNKELVQQRMQDIQYRRGVEFGLYHGGYFDQLSEYLATGELNIEGLEGQIPGLAGQDAELSGQGSGDGSGEGKGMSQALDEIFENQ